MGWASGSTLLGDILDSIEGFTQEDVDILCDLFEERDCDTIGELTNHPMVLNWDMRRNPEYYEEIREDDPEYYKRLTSALG